jgi:L-2-hydroxyglutarate oxidase LhgO
MRVDFDCVIAGAGAIGLAIGRQMAASGRSTLILEAADALGTHTSSRNSEVIHAGFYYPPGSLKAESCVRGRAKLYDYCNRRGVAFRKIGKLVVACSPTEEAVLHGLLERGAANGVAGLRLMSRAAVTQVEPELSCSLGLWSPETGIVDSHAYMAALETDLLEMDGIALLRSPITGGRCEQDHVVLEVGGAEPTTVTAALFVNAAGLYAPDVARAIADWPDAALPEPRYAKGVYYTMSGRCPFSHLIYPVPADGGLGIHLTLDLAGQARFGPDVEWVDAIDYRTDTLRTSTFEAEIRRYWPALPSGRLHPAYAGVRPKVAIGGTLAQDFVLRGPAEHAGAPLIALYGIESPGLTASLDLADRAMALVGEAIDARETEHVH